MLKWKLRTDVYLPCTSATDPRVVPAPEPSPQPDTFKKKDVIEILSHKKAYNACKYIMAYYYVWLYRRQRSCMTRK